MSKYTCIEEDKEEVKDKQGEEFKLTFVYLMTFADKIKGGQRELIVRGNDLILRKGRRLADDDIPLVCKFLHQHPEVTALDLAYNRLTEAGMMTIVEFLSTHDSLRRLNVMGNNIGALGIQSLAHLAERMPLESLRVNSNKIGPAGGKSLSLLLSCNTRLRHLDVGESDQTLASLAYFTTAIRYNDTLQLLDISRPIGLWMHSFDSAHWAETLGQALQHNTALRELHLQKSALTDHDIELLLRGLKHNSTLLLLDLCCNRLGNHGVELLGGYLVQRPGLLGLLLGHNIIGDLGVRSLSFTLPFCKVQLLDLSHNQLTDQGLLELLQTIKKPVMLRALFIWGNRITHKSCPVLRRMLLSGVLNGEWVDFKIYRVDGVDYLAYNHVDRSRHMYYCVGDVAFPQPRRIPPPREVSIPTQLICPRVPHRPYNGKHCPYGASHARHVGLTPFFCK